MTKRLLLHNLLLSSTALWGKGEGKGREGKGREGKGRGQPTYFEYLTEYHALLISG